MRGGAVVVVCAVAALVHPAAAGAETFCVGAPPGCVGTPQAVLGAAFQAAETNGTADRIEIAAAEWDEAAPAAPFIYDDPEPLEIVGQGRGQTVLVDSSPGANEILLALDSQGAGPVTVTDLTLQIGADDQTGEDALRLANGASGRRLDVVLEPGSSSANATGFLVEGGATLTEVAADLIASEDSEGVRAIGPPRLALSEATLRADASALFVGVDDSSSLNTVRGARLTSNSSGISVQKGMLRADDALVRVLDPGGTGLEVSNGNNQPGTFGMDGRHVTVIGTEGCCAGAAARVFAEEIDPGTQSPFLTLRDSILADFESSIVCFDESALGDDVPSLTLAFVSRGPGETINPTCDLSITNPLSSSPGFVAPGAGDYRLAASSLLIDSATPGGLGAGEPALDLNGAPRLADGDNDGVRRRDPGAFERVGGATSFGGELALSYRRKKRRFRGSFDAALTRCAGGRIVEIFRVRKGPDRRVASVTTDSGGDFSKKRKRTRRGRYYASIDSVSLVGADAGDRCGADESKRVRVKKRKRR